MNRSIDQLNDKPATNLLMNCIFVLQFSYLQFSYFLQQSHFMQELLHAYRLKRYESILLIDYNIHQNQYIQQIRFGFW